MAETVQTIGDNFIGQLVQNLRPTTILQIRKSHRAIIAPVLTGATNVESDSLPHTGRF